MYFSKEGFSVGNTVMLWVGWVLAAIVTIVELVFNSPTQKLSITLIVVGVLCYIYGIWTNVTGFWEIQHPGSEFMAMSSKSLLSWFVGFIMEVLPEPLFMWGIAATFDGDFLGNLIGLWSGNLDHATPNKQQPQQKQNKPGNPYVAQHKPAHLNVQNLQHARQNFPAPSRNPKPYPRPSAYLQALQEMQEDGELIG
jgi:hypothetical protein